MLAAECDVQVGVLNLAGKRNKSRLERAGVRVIDLGKRYRFDPMSIGRALKWARATGVDIVQAEQTSAYPHAWMISRCLDAPLVVWLNTPISPFEGPSWHIRWGSRFMFPRADHTVCNSHYTRGRLLHYYPSLAERSSVIYHCIEEKFFFPSGRRPLRTVGVVTTMISVKKLERLLRAWPQVVARFPDATLEVYGDGPERARWEALAQELHLSSGVRFHGFVNDVAEALSKIGVFVLPTEGEAFGQAFVEAMLMERPCVGVQSGGVPEIVVNGETGLLVPPGDDPHPLAQAILRLLEQPDQADTMGKAGRMRALACFAPEAVRPTYMAFYRRLMEKRR